MRPSPTLDEIVVTTASICSKMRSDGFGGSVVRITTDTIQYASNVEMREVPAIPEAINGVAVCLEPGIGTGVFPAWMPRKFHNTYYAIKKCRGVGSRMKCDLPIIRLR